MSTSAEDGAYLILKSIGWELHRCPPSPNRVSKHHHLSFAGLEKAFFSSDCLLHVSVGWVATADCYFWVLLRHQPWYFSCWGLYSLPCWCWASWLVLHATPQTGTLSAKKVHKGVFCAGASISVRWFKFLQLKNLASLSWVYACGGFWVKNMFKTTTCLLGSRNSFTLLWKVNRVFRKWGVQVQFGNKH